MNDMVKVTLDRQRPYRAKHTDKDAVWVGPGEAEVPRWVAEKWGMAEPAQEVKSQQPAAQAEQRNEADAVKTAATEPSEQVAVESKTTAKGRK